MIFTSLLSMGVSSGKVPITTAKKLYDQMLAFTAKSNASMAPIGRGRLVVDLEAAQTRVGAAQMDVLTEDLMFKMACDDFLESDTAGGK